MEQWIGSFATGLATHIANQIFEPELRSTGYANNKRRPNVYPDVGTCIGLYHKGYFNIDGLKNYSAIRGYDSEELNWNKINYVHNHPERNYANPFLVVNPEHSKGGGSAFECLVNSCGFTPSNDEAMVMRNRQLIGQGLFNTIVDRNCGADTPWNAVYNQLRYVIPSVSDLISFSVREAFNTTVIEKFEYNKELPIEILPWLEKQGLAGGTGFKMPAGSTTTIGADTREFAQWFDHYWWAHWQLPSLSAGYDMLHRFYVSSRYGPSPDLRKPDGSPDMDLAFSMEDMDTLHKAQDYPQYWRKRLSALSYLPLTRTDVRRMRQINVFKDPSEVYHAYRAIGYNDQNAERLAQFTEELAKPKNRKKSESAAKRICQMRSLFIIEEHYALTLLEQLGYSNDDATAYLTQCQLDLYYDEIRGYIKTIRTQFLKGKINWTKAENGLRQFIPNDADIERLFNRWKTELNIKYRELSTSDIKKALKNDTISVEEFYTRLDNLGYNKSEIDILFDTIQAELDHETESTIRRGLTYFNAKKIAELYESDILQKEDIVNILRSKGWASVAIDTFLLENSI